MNILFVSDFVRPSGYATIGGELAEGWHRAGHNVLMLGNDYDAQPHNFSYSIVPLHTDWLPEYIGGLLKEIRLDWVLLSMDLPKQLAVMERLLHREPKAAKTKFAGIFPVESNPLGKQWAAGIKKYYRLCFTYTDFGVQTCAERGITAIKIPVGISDFWQFPPLPLPPNLKLPLKYVLTVATNHSRKNLPAAFEIMSKVKIPYIVVTDTDIGWDLAELQKQTGVSNHLLYTLDARTVDDRLLRTFYDHASVFLLTSLSEGIGLPVYEAQARGVPAVATDCCGLSEAVADKRLLIKVAHKTISPWGNSFDYWADADDGAEKVKLALSLKSSFNKLELPSWRTTSAVIIKNLEEYINVPVEDESRSQTFDPDLWQTVGSMGGYNIPGLWSPGVIQSIS